MVCGTRCLAVVQLTGPAASGKTEFATHLQLLQRLIHEFVSAHADWLSQVEVGSSVQSEATSSADQDESGRHEPPHEPRHPQVTRALDYIHHHLSDTDLNVTAVAAHLGMCSTYLGQIFTEGVGQRMSSYITVQRLEKAKSLLIGTDWQIKRIAIETGYANPNWFSHVFATHTGMPPRQFRLRSKQANGRSAQDS